MLPLDRLLGNDLAKTYLRHMITSQRVHGTLIFAGQEGIGKGVAARLFAEELGCRPSDIREYFPEGKAHIHTMEAMSSLREEASEHPFESKRKTLIIHDAHRMLPSSANALLKTLEEPLQTTHIILTTTDNRLLMETIISRAVLVRFSPISVDVIAEYLEKKGMSRDEAEKKARYSRGSLEKAISFEASEQIDLLLTSLLSMVGNRPKVPEALDTLKKIEAEIDTIEVEKLPHICDYILESILLWHSKRHLEAIQQKNEPTLSYEIVFNAVKNAHSALQSNIKIRPLLEEIFFTLS